MLILLSSAGVFCPLTWKLQALTVLVLSVLSVPYLIAFIHVAGSETTQ